MSTSGKMFHVTIEAARVNVGLTQQKMADLLHVNKTTVGNWEKGLSSPSLEQGREISEITGIPLDYLVVRNESNQMGKIRKEE